MSAITKLVWIYLCVFESIMGNTNYLNATSKLHDTLLEGYKKSIRPMLETPIGIYFYLRGINEFDDIEGHLEPTGIAAMTWNDSRMSWNPKDYGGVMVTSFRLEQVWRPNIALLNPVDKFELIDYSMRDNIVWYNFLGMASFLIGGVFPSTCDPNIEHFPFDDHECSVIFLPFEDFIFQGKHNNTIYIKQKVVDDESSRDEDGKWRFTTLKPCIVAVGTTNLIAAAFPMKLHRRFTFMFVNIVVPILLLSFLNVCVFLIPVQAGERISFAITVVLSFSVYMTIMASYIPETSNPMPMISYFLIFKLAYSACIALSIVIGIRMFHRTKEIPIPAVFQSLTRFIEKNHIQILRLKPNKDNNFLDRQTSLSPSIRHQSDSDTNLETNENLDILTWQRVSAGLDKLFIFFFLVLAVIEVILFWVLVIFKLGREEENTDSMLCANGVA